MKKPIFQLFTTAALLTHSCFGLTAVNPITVTYSNGNGSFSTGGSGSANYVVSVNSGVIPPNVPLTFHLTGSGSSSSSLVATQQLTGPSLCPNVSALCGSTFSLSAGQSCCLAFSLTSTKVGDYTLQPSINTTPATYPAQASSALSVKVTSAPNTATLTTTLPSSNTLALSVLDAHTHPALTGNPRAFTITNSSTTTTAHNVTFSATSSSARPEITSNATPTSSCGDIAPLGTCVLTVAPTDATPTTAPYVTPLTPITLTIQGSNTNTLSSTVNILTYGNIYQEGFVYSVDDTPGCPTTPPPISPSNPCAGSIGGKVASLVDQAEPRLTTGPQLTSIIWSSNGAGSTPGDVSNDIIPSIAETPTLTDSYNAAQAQFNTTYANTTTYPFPLESLFVTCSGATQGSCNSANILTLYNMYVTNYGGSNHLSPGPTTPTYYAAGLCTATINGYSDWYLPAICEMATGENVICPLGTQSMQGSLAILVGDPNPSNGAPSTSCHPPVSTNCLAGGYWSSTEASKDPQSGAWYQFFASSGSDPEAANKGFLLGVRCSRALTL